MTEHDFAMIGIVLSALIVLCIVVALVLAIAEKAKDWTRSHERKWKMERLLDECNADLTRLEARVAALEGKEVRDD
jgi:hypothetical protein